MRNFEWKRLMGIGLSVFALSVGSIGLTGCETQADGEAEELGEDIDEAAEDVGEAAEDAKEEVEQLHLVRATINKNQIAQIQILFNQDYSIQASICAD